MISQPAKAPFIFSPAYPAQEKQHWQSSYQNTYKPATCVLIPLSRDCVISVLFRRKMKVIG